MYDSIISFLDFILINFVIILDQAEVFFGIAYKEINFWLAPILLIVLICPFIIIIFLIGKIFKDIKDEIYLYSFISLFIGLISFFTYFNSIFLVTSIIGESMLPNFQKEYEILGNNYYLKNKIQYGDVITIEGHNKTRGNGLVKRVIGLPGDKIKIQNGQVILNGKVLEQKNDGKFRFNGKTYEREIEYISNDKSYKILNDGNHYSQDFLSELTVPKNHYFVLGDNRDHSGDSRYYGSFHRSYIKHKVMITQSKLLTRISYIFLGYYDLK